MTMTMPDDDARATALHCVFSENSQAKNVDLKDSRGRVMTQTTFLNIAKNMHIMFQAIPT